MILKEFRSLLDGIVWKEIVQRIFLLTQELEG